MSLKVNETMSGKITQHFRVTKRTRSVHTAQVRGLARLMERRAMRNTFSKIMYAGSIQSTSMPNLTGKRDVEEPEVVRPPKRIAVYQPDYFTVKLKYGERIRLAGTSGASAFHEFALNSIVKPNITATGHTPNGFQLWRTFYKYYRVLRCEAKIVFMTNDAAVNQLTGVRVTHETGTPTHVSTLFETKHGDTQPMGVLNGGYGMVEYTRDVYPGEYDENVINRSNLDASTSGQKDGSASGFWTSMVANPAALIRLQLGTQDIARTATATTDVWVELVYTVQMREVGTATGSTEDMGEESNSGMLTEDT